MWPHHRLKERHDMKRWLWLLVLMVPGCGLTITDHGSEVHFHDITLLYTDWVAPAQSNWQKDSYECGRSALEAYPSFFRLPGQRQSFAEQCLAGRGYTKRI
jgi:hypothetical protein